MQQLSLVDQTETYLASRADTMRSIEHTIVELGEIFQQLATMSRTSASTHPQPPALMTPIPLAPCHPPHSPTHPSRLQISDTFYIRSQRTYPPQSLPDIAASLPDNYTNASPSPLVLVR
ncbi:Syntaxin 5 [Fasciola gigantica]|uniref:Syntaxin 5 n=1 Tax=Fasciola gigantica TaxID=46835 RepID=A0A504Y6T3_FASGI|nr:Syntaxin 5 [Fasciola gigantica]